MMKQRPSTVIRKAIRRVRETETRVVSSSGREVHIRTIPDTQTETQLQSQAGWLRPPCIGSQAEQAEDDPLCKARLAILAAKSAYQFRSERWLCLVSAAVSAIEQCPPECQPHLIQRLQGLHRPQPRRIKRRA